MRRSTRRPRRCTIGGGSVHDWPMDTCLFSVEGQERSWEAVRFSKPWNGWLTPITTRETLENLLDVLGDGHRWEGDIAVVWPTIDLDEGESHDPDTEDRIAPDDDGNYDLGTLGWTFIPA